MRTFVVMAKELNFHRAAERLFLAQPTVTVHIRQLEEYVGYVLFERVGRKVRLTEAGQRFRLHADRILEAHDEALSDLTRWKMGYEDRLDLLMAPLCAEFMLPLVWERYTTAYPHVEMRVYTTLSPSVGAGIAAGRSHIGLSRIPSMHPDTESSLLHPDPVVLIAPGQVQQESIHYLELLQDHPLLTNNHPEYWDDILYQLHAIRAPMRPMTISQVHVTKRLIAKGRGISFLPLSAVQEELLDGQLCTVGTPDLRMPEAGTYIITPRDKAISQSATEFLALLREEASTIQLIR